MYVCTTLRPRSKINIKGDEKIFGRLNGAEEEMDLSETGYNEVKLRNLEQTQRLGLRVTSHREKLSFYVAVAVVVTVSIMLKSIFRVFLVRGRRSVRGLIHNMNYL
jgi:hypothetical protein